MLNTQYLLQQILQTQVADSLYNKVSP